MKKIINEIRNYVLEEEFKLFYYNNKLDILNYKSIGHFDSSHVIVRYDNGQILIKGTDLVVSKLLNDEILISGSINNIEFR